MGGRQCQSVVAGNGRWVVRFVIAQRANACIGAENVTALKLMIEVGVDHVEQVVGFLIGDRHLGRIARVFTVGGADQCETIKVRNAENDALVFVLQNVGVLAFIQPRDDQMTPWIRRIP